MAKKKKKKSTKKATSKRSTNSQQAESTASKKIERPFPRASISEAIRIPLALREYNGGNSWPPNECKAVVDASIGNATVRSNQFFYLTAASRDFGFTNGTRDAEEISLTDRGRSFVFAESEEAEREALRSAFFSVDIFAHVFEYYRSERLPDKKYVANTLENQFGLPPEVHDEFLELFKENVQFLRLNEVPTVEVEPKVSQQGGTENLSKIVYGGVEADGLIVVAEPDGESDKTCFVAIPFTEKSGDYPSGFFAEVLENLVGPSAAEAGFRVITARRSGSDVIQSTIVNSLLDADLVVADLTEHNPNVLFELGLRMAMDKPVALIRSKGTSKIFDVDNMLRVFDYSPQLWKSTMSADLPNLTAHLRASWDRRNSERTFMKILRGAEQETVPKGTGK